VKFSIRETKATLLTKTQRQNFHNFSPQTVAIFSIFPNYPATVKSLFLKKIIINRDIPSQILIIFSINKILN